MGAKVNRAAAGSVSELWAAACSSVHAVSSYNMRSSTGTMILLTSSMDTSDIARADDVVYRYDEVFLRCRRRGTGRR